MDDKELQKQRTISQNSALHRGFSDIANVLVERGIGLDLVIKELEIRPTMASVKSLYRAIASAKYGVDSTAQLKSNEVSEVWEDLARAVSITSGEYVAFPSSDPENYQDYL